MLYFLKTSVFTRLEEGDILVSQTDRHAGERRPEFLSGLPDNVGIHATDDGCTISSIVEINPSHNLLLPNNVDAICDRYKEAFDKTSPRQNKQPP